MVVAWSISKAPCEHKSVNDAKQWAQRQSGVPLTWKLHKHRWFAIGAKDVFFIQSRRTHNTKPRLVTHLPDMSKKVKVMLT